MESGWPAATSSTCRERAPGRLLAWAGVLAAALAAAPARGERQLEPVLRLSLEGAYDSNPLYDGRSDARTRASPELGLRVSDHLWDFSGVYGADYLTYRRIDPDGVWNQRGALDLRARPTERTEIAGTARGLYAVDSVGLAQAGVFREGRERALLLAGGLRAEHGLTRHLVGALSLSERLVRFEDRTGGAMHAPTAELLWRVGERLLVGGAYSSSVFQDFHPEGDERATAQGVRARARYRISRFLEADAFAGPAFWSGPEGRALVPEGGVELRLTRRDWDLRANFTHGLGLGSTATPGLGNTLELGTVRRFGRRFDLRADGGLWQSGTVPDGRDSTTGVALAGEAGWYVTRELRLAVAAAWLARLDDTSSDLRRSTLGIRMGWELPAGRGERP